MEVQLEKLTYEEVLGRLNDRQRRFVEEYLIDLNATQAAIRAGYSERTARQQGARLLSNAVIQAAIEAAQQARSERTELTQDWVLSKLRENVERAMQAEPVRDRDGNPTGEFVYAGAVANKALELLGKHLDLFSDRLTRLSIDMSTLSDEQLERIAGGEDPLSVLAHGA